MSGIRVYVGGIPKTVVNRDLEVAFERFGKIVNVWLARNPPGFAFVVRCVRPSVVDDFEDPRDADDAIKDMDGKEILGERVRVQLARGGVRRGTKDERSDDRDHRDRDHRDRDRDYRDRDRDRDRDHRDRDRDRRDRRDDDERRGGRERSSGGHKVRVSGLSRNVDWRDVKDYIRKAGDVTFCDMDGDDAIVELASKSDLDNVIRKLDDTEFDGRRIRIKPAGGRDRSRSHSPRDRRRPSRSRSPGDRHRSPPPRKNSD
ncbi:Aste57867_10510 [Aphanomyces stellatus]|uniref:Aste57867_10510 protein n=1 Tax=Aphanomyces stellatus TaxID=120398 RepID=A0A485KQJ4_9STRA|nr:hypothetical protein As57867_010470 [Aphanomyces stellatus]VFT87383.1 Aste57867_10510 [Aphanomyces stellatus]